MATGSTQLTSPGRAITQTACCLALGMSNTTTGWSSLVPGTEKLQLEQNTKGDKDEWPEGGLCSLLKHRKTLDK